MNENKKARLNFLFFHLHITCAKEKPSKETATQKNASRNMIP